MMRPARIAFFCGVLLGLWASFAAAQCPVGACQAPVNVQMAAPAPLRIRVPGPEIVVQQDAPRVRVERGVAPFSGESCYSGSYGGGFGYGAMSAPRVYMGAAVYETPVYAGSFGGAYGASYGASYFVDEAPYAGIQRMGVVEARSRNRMFRAAVNRGANISSFGRDDFDIRHRSILQRIFW
jgi:hypothetical protein